MKFPLKTLMPLLAIVALAAACNPFAHKTAPQYPKDPRFSEFVFDFNEEPKIQTRVDSLNLRWPGLAASEAHITVEYSRSGFGIPQTEPEFWITAVATVPDETGGVWVFRTVCFERVVLSSPGCLWPGRMDDHEEVLEAHA